MSVPAPSPGHAGWLVLCLALASTPVAAASGVTITAFAGGGYLLDSTERPGVWSTRSMFDFTAGVSIDGGFLRPQLLFWKVKVAYLGNWRPVHQGSASAFDALSFGARIGLLSGTPTPINLTAQRGNTWASETAPRRATGTSTTTGFGGDVSANFLQYPRLTAGLFRTIVVTASADGRQTSSGLTTLRVGARQQLRRLEYSADYVANWSNGTFADLEYGSHNVNVRAAAPLTPALQFNVNDQYFARLPTSAASTNPRYEANSFNTSVNWRRSDRVAASFGYANLQSSAAAPGGLALSTSTHSLSESLMWRWRDDLIVSQNLSGMYSKSRSGADGFVGAGGNLGAGLNWLRPTAWGGGSLGVAGSFGLAGDELYPVAPSWGANVDGQLFGRLGRITASGNYSLAYSDGGARVFGRSFRQNLRLEATYVPARSWRTRIFLAGIGARKENAVIGTALQRNLQGIAEVSFRQHSLALFGAYGDGLPESLGNPVFADGLFLPAPWNSQFVNFGGTLTTAFFNGKLTFNATGRFTQTSGLMRRPEQEVGFTFVASVTIARFRLSAEDRLVFGGIDSAWYRNNIFMVRLTRDFDWSF